MRIKKNLRLARQCITLMQEINTIFIDRLLPCRVFRRVHPTGIRIFNSLPQSITNLKNEKTHFKVALKNFLNAHSFYSVDEFFTCTDDTRLRWSRGSVLALSTQVRGFKPGRSRRIFKGEKKSSARLPSEGK